MHKRRGGSGGWRILVMRRAERIWEVLKGLEYTLKKRVFTTLTIRYFLYPKPRTQLDMEGVYTEGEGLEYIVMGGGADT
jgi:hypothetical protein